MHNLKKFLSAILLAGLLPGTTRTATAQTASPFELKDGDRVAFIGDTFIEREQYHGWIELMLTTRFPDRHVTFRNLGWSADTPAGASREGLSLLQAGKEPAGEGWNQLTNQIAQVKPTVAFIGYGMASSFDGEPGLPKFKVEYNRLLDAIAQISPGVRLVLLSPVAHENLGQPWPDARRHDAEINAYRKAIEEIARARNLRFVNVALEPAPGGQLTSNGIHLNDAGYMAAAVRVQSELGLAYTQGGLSWKTAPNTEALRDLILHKNELFFHRSRPANMAYIFGFRKHEQGRNAVEIPQFDPLIEAEEKKIRELCRQINNKDFKPGPELRPSPRPNAAKPAQVAPQPHPVFTLAPGFQVNLYAENPLLAKPIQMNFDSRGRLWVVSSSVYPQIEPGQEPDDKVLLLEDTDGDGVAEKSTVFADGLLIPTGIAPGDGGVYVAQSTELLFFQDRDGDGKADLKRIVLSGFGTEDTHHNLHTLRWGFDGRLYMNQSVYTRTHTETPHGVVRLKAGGGFGLDTRSQRMEITFRGLWNSWGQQFDRYGQSFLSDGAGFNGLFYSFPGASFNPTPGARRVMDSISPGVYPKFCGMEVVASRHFPDDWQGDLITCDFRAHRIVRFKVSEQGAGYVTQEAPDLMRTMNNTFRPIDVRFGPDGALYVADWSNPIIQHGEVDFRDPRRDKTHGRIWRISHKERPLNERPKLAEAANSALLDQLLSPNGFNKEHARRVLTERGEAILTDLNAWTKKQTEEAALLEALWMHQAISSPDTDLLKKLLAAKDGRIRAAAVRVLGYWIDYTHGASDLLAARIKDEQPHVRLEAVRALSRIPSARAADLVLSALDQPMDPYLDYAVWISINELVHPWLEAVKSGAWNPAGREKQLEFALKAIEPEQASSVLNQFIQGKPLAGDGSGPWIELIASAGGAKELRQLYDQVLRDGFDETATARALRALGEAARLRNLKPAGTLEVPDKLLDSRRRAVQLETIRLVGRWKLSQFVSELLGFAGHAETLPELRAASFDALREIGGSPVAASLRPLCAKPNPLPIRQQAVLTLASLELNRSLPLVMEVLADSPGETEALALWRPLLNIRGAGQAITKALPKSPLPEAAARAGLRAAQEGGRKEPDLVLALGSSVNLSPEPEEMTAQDLLKLGQQAMREGDPARGEMVYRRPEFGCVACHAIGGAGGKVGPDMTSIGASAPVDYIIESLLFPNRKIKEGYHSILVETKDDQEFSGILVRETGTELVIRNAANQEISVAKNNIAKRSTGMSLMPTGLIDALPQKDRLDLYRFLAELGKPGPFDASQGGTARVWNIFTLTSTDNQFGRTENVLKADFSIKGWNQAVATVPGWLLKADLESQLGALVRRGPLAVYAVTQFRVTQPGRVNFNLESPVRTEVFINGTAVKASGQFSAELPAGTHVLALKFDPQELPAQIRVRSGEAAFATE